MYELADWGQPAPPDWVERRERLEARLPADLLGHLRTRAQIEGIAFTDLIERILRDAVDPAAAMMGNSTDVSDF